MDFIKSYFGKNEPLTSWTLLSPIFFQISAVISTDLEKNGGQKCSFLSKYFLQNPYFSKMYHSCCMNISFSKLDIFKIFKNNFGG